MGRQFKDVYRLAYDQGCKGCTTYRPNETTGAVLSKTDTPPAGESQSPAGPVGIANRPEELPGQTYKIRWPHSEHAIYVTINDILEESLGAGGESAQVRKPFEIFINSKNMDHYAWTLALTRMISAVFRRGGNVRFVAEELGAVFDPQGGAFVNGRYAPSLLAVIGGVIECRRGGTGGGRKGRGGDHFRPAEGAAVPKMPSAHTGEAGSV